MGSRPNVVWVTLESTRADHTSLDGYDRETTPNLERIADAPEGRSYAQAFANGIWTLASSASILTGTYASRHDTGVESDVLPDELRTVPELLGECGYHSACLTTNPHISDETGLSRGFDRFGWLAKSNLLEVVGPRTLAKYLLNLRRHSAGFTTDTAKHNTGYMITDAAKRWLRSFRGNSEPFFLYLHYGDPHHPYVPPLPYRGRYLEDVPLSERAATDLAMHHHDDLNELIADGCPFTAAEWDALQAFYDAEIAYTDALVGHLFDYATALDEDTVFVVTADHGELFGEGGMLAHKVVLHDAVAHVPLVVHGMDALADHEGEMVQHVDVVRTLLDEIGADTDGMQGIDLRSERREYSILQRGAKRTRKNLRAIREHEPGFDVSRYHDGPLDAIRTERFKFQQSPDGAELFRLPDEETDVSDAYPDVAEELSNELEAWRESAGQPVATERREEEYSESMREQLSDLGYLT